MTILHASHPSNSPAELVGVRIRELRERADESRRALADRAHTHAANLARIEHGKVNPSLNTLARIAAALGTSVADLVRDVPAGHLPE